MKKAVPFSRQYVRVVRLANSAGLIVSIGAAIILGLLPFLMALPEGSDPYRSLGILAVIGVLCASRLESLQENEAIHKAIIESAKKNDQ